MRKRSAIIAMLVSVMMLLSLSTTTFACTGYQPEKAKYTVYYREYGTNIQLAPSVTKSAVIGTTVTEKAIDIDNYKVYGDSIKSVKISRCRCNTITFYYKKEEVQLTDYKVRYLEMGTEKVLAPEKVVKDQQVGSEVTEEAIDIEGYSLVGDKMQSLKLKGSSDNKSSTSVAVAVTREEALQIALDHAGLLRSDIKYLEIEKERLHGAYIYEIEFYCAHGYEYEYEVECTTGRIIDYEKECTKCEKADIDATTLRCHKDDEKNTDNINVITFYYEKKQVLTEYVVRYIDRNEEPVCSEKVVKDVEIGAEITEAAVDVEGYVPDEPTEITRIMGADGNEFVFIYHKASDDY